MLLRRSLSSSGVAWFAVLLALGMGRCAQGQSGAPSSWARGRALFEGREPLAGRLRDQPEAMPAAVVICAHCHAAPGQARVKGSDAPALDRAALTGFVSRRHGPPSSYGRESFCKVLRTGVDPVSVVLSKTMPVYTMDEPACGSLWMFLTSTPMDESRPRPMPGDR